MSRYNGARFIRHMARSKSVRARLAKDDADAVCKRFVRVAGNYTLTCDSYHCQDRHKYTLEVHWHFGSPHSYCVYETFTDAESANRRYHELVELYEKSYATGN